MKRILLFGDSNTWGLKPIKEYNFIERYNKEERWSGILQEKLGKDYQIIEEGNPGRTTIWDDPIEGYKNGKLHLISCLDSHQPLDAVVIMLGTNDLKYRFSLSSFDIARSAGVLVRMVQLWEPLIGESPKVLLIAPPCIKKTPDFFEGMFTGALEKSKNFSFNYKKVAEDLGCEFLDAGEIIKASDLDGIHLEKGAHFKLGIEVKEKIRKMLS